MNIKNNIREYFQIRNEAKIITFRSLNQNELFIYKSHKISWLLSFVFLITGIFTLSLLLFLNKKDLFNILGFIFLGLLFIFYMSLLVFSSENYILVQETDKDLKGCISYLKKERYKKGKTNLSSAMSKWLTLKDSDNYSIEHQIRNYDKQHRIFANIIKNEINHQDSNGDTILHYMLREDPQSPFIAKALLLNADIHIKNNKGVSAYDLLIKHNPEYIAFIEKAFFQSATSFQPEKRKINRL